MATCKSCGTEIGEGKFCPACGMSQGEVAAAQSTRVVPAPTPSYMGDTQGQTTPQASNTVPYYSQPGPSDMPNRSGQLIFSIVNLVLGVLFCCCGGFFTMVLGIIATVLCVQVDKAPSADEARRKLKTVMILNIVAISLLVLGIIGTVIWSALAGDGGTYSYDYYYNMLD